MSSLRESRETLERAAAQAGPELRPVVELCVKFARECEAEVERATEEASWRVKLAEDTVRKTVPHMQTILKRAHDAEDQVAAHQRAEYARRSAERARVDAARVEVAKRAAKADVAKAVAESGAALAGVIPLVEKFIACHAQVEPSLITYREKYGPFTVKTADDRVFAVCESRADALAAVDRLLAREKASQGLGQDPHQRRPRGGETQDVETAGGLLDGKRIKRSRSADVESGGLFDGKPIRRARAADVESGGRFDGRRIKRNRAPKRARLL